MVEKDQEQTTVVKPTVESLSKLVYTQQEQIKSLLARIADVEDACNTFDSIIPAIAMQANVTKDSFKYIKPKEFVDFMKSDLKPFRRRFIKSLKRLRSFYLKKKKPKNLNNIKQGEGKCQQTRKS